MIEGRALAFIAFLYHSPSLKAKMIPFYLVLFVSLQPFRNRIGDFLQTE